MHTLNPTPEENEDAVLEKAFADRLSPIKEAMRPDADSFRKALTQTTVTNTSTTRLIATDIPKKSVPLITLIQDMFTSKKLAFAAASIVLVAGSLIYLSVGREKGSSARVAEEDTSTAMTPARDTGDSLTADSNSTVSTAPAGSSTDMDALTSVFASSEDDGLSDEDTLASDSDVDDSLLSLNSDIDENSF